MLVSRQRVGLQLPPAIAKCVVAPWMLDLMCGWHNPIKLGGGWEAAAGQAASRFRPQDTACPCTQAANSRAQAAACLLAELINHEAVSSRQVRQAPTISCCFLLLRLWIVPVMGGVPDASTVELLLKQPWDWP